MRTIFINRLVKKTISSTFMRRLGRLVESFDIMRNMVDNSEYNNEVTKLVGNNLTNTDMKIIDTKSTDSNIKKDYV